MSPLVDHAEGGDENQPHNSASTANQDIVAAQLAAMQQQFGVFQLVLAQLLARNNPGDPLINLLNPAPQPPTPQQNPEPVQHAPTLNSLEKLVAEQRGAPPPHHVADSIPHPLNTNITLPPRSINSYTEMASAFAIKFSSRRLIRKTTFELIRVKQRDRESLKNYMSRFNDAVLERPTPSKNQNPDWRDENRSRKWMRTAQNRGPMSTSTPRFGRPNSAPPQQSAGKPSVTWIPFNLPRSQIFMQIKNKMNLRRPGPMRTVAASRDHTKYCDFHQDHDHTTEQCNNLRSELESLAQKGMLNEYIQRAEQLRFVREQGPQPQGTRVVTPHNNALVISVMINNCQVQRVLVDTGSAPDIMYYHCFESLGLNPALLQRYDGPIYGFNNQPVPVEGILTMNIAFGSGRTYVTPSVRFLVVKMPSSFNVVIGWSTLTKIRVVVSQSHLCMKFSTFMGIATLRGNQEVARHCYLTSVTRPQKNKDQPAKNPPPEIHNNRQVMGTQIGTRLKPEERAELIAFFRANKDVFAWTSADMPGIPTSACPKDCYPMPNTDKLVEVASGNERLSLLDAYSGYHQVPMALGDEEKTSFYVGDEIYCYVMMPFGLKNAGATYQKMVTIVFRAQIGRNLEVYVDDIVVKSLKIEDHLTDLEETFNNLRKNRMRLNSAKYIFGVELGKFLGFMVSRRGIEVNLEKIKAVAEMKPPKLIKDIMRLAAQKDESGKQKKFEWNSECQAAFDELKSYLSSPPLLTKANDGEILYFYLSISDETISFVLVREEGKQQKPVYYTSSVLHGAEIRYSITEKAALAVVTSARKLRPYFQSHPIIVLMNQPLRQILQKPECSGRLIKWAVELGEFEITFQQRSAIRAQALVDFIVECTSAHSDSQPGLDNWILYVDEASSNKGSSVGAILLGLDGYRSEHALKFNFDATNNMAEYEALLLGLQLAIELKVVAIQIYSDSQLVVNQVNSVYEVVDPVMMKYATLVAELKSKFQKFQLRKIPRAEKEQADSLSKFASDGNRMPADKQEEMRLRKKASWYTLVNDVLYKRSFSLPLLRCLNPYEAEYALWEVHESVCGSHIGPFMKGVGSVTHLIVGVNYFTKWVEIRPLSSLTSKKVEDFVFSSIICRYGIPNQIVADNGTQFNCSSFRDFCSSYGIKLQFILVYHPESNWMVESVNKVILEGIKPRLELHKARWADELNNVLWAYRTTSETPYHLAFGTEAVISIEIGVPSFRVTHFDEGRNEQLLRENLDLLDEVREEARLRTLVYKQKIDNFYNKRARPRTFKVEDLVLKKAGLTGFETRFEKLAPNWEGPYTVAEVP
ncbi:hypothetical protein SLEP1_g52347 [Rubroshorea leprosula]|uniref:Uncharacterized protein n=1 Tax=Rubroshorea leprosula TaxID=152421 RepID=A0AAV5M6W0_9ROSI|nr:hypothetical protein SLEP1_g52347 [Rubroshorea leprosula]